MPARNPTVADWIAEGETTIVVYCVAPGCGHDAVLKLDTLPQKMTRDTLEARSRCAACGARGGQVMRDMAALYERMQATGWDCDPFKGSSHG